MVPTLVLGYILVRGSREEMETGNTISEFKRAEVCTGSKTWFTTVYTEDKTMATDWTRSHCCRARCGTMSPSDLQDDCELFSDGRWWMKRREKNIWINIRINMSSSL